jgi:hypothetical protein
MKSNCSELFKEVKTRHRSDRRLPSFPLHYFIVLADAGSIHLNANKIKPINAGNATHSGAVNDSNSSKGKALRELPYHCADKAG